MRPANDLRIQISRSGWTAGPAAAFFNSPLATCLTTHLHCGLCTTSAGQREGVSGFALPNNQGRP